MFGPCTRLYGPSHWSNSPEDEMLPETGEVLEKSTEEKCS